MHRHFDRPRLVVFGLIAAIGVAVATGSLTAADDRVDATGGAINIRPLAHASVQIEHAGKVIQVDPWMRARLDTAQPADLILITDADAGGHHLDPAAIMKVRKAGAPIVMPASGRTKVPDGIVLANGDRREVAGVMVEAIAAYDLIPGDPFHAKGVANGYLITLGGKRILLAGVTECVPEIRALKNLDVVFVPMNLPQGRMTPAAVADCLRTLRPALAYPYHFDQGYIGRLSGRGGQPQPGQPSAPDTVKALADAVKADKIEVRLGDWYPAPGAF
jgi:L-ascorbate metabolism protein UlaG (beta-lactamase superfamily)